MNPLIAKILKNGPVITDGAWGTALQDQGLKPGESPDVWNLSHPDRVEAVARGYVEAGSQVILTNTFGANRYRLAEARVGADVAAINRAGAEISCRAAGQRARVFASIGPSGKMLMMGDVTAEELQEAFAVQAGAMAEGGADAIVIETMADLEEAGLAVDAAKATGLPVVACMVYDSGEAKDRTMMGTTPEEAAKALTARGADVIGANCGQGIEGFVGICQRLKAATDRPIWIKANAGMPKVVKGVLSYPTEPAEFASYVPKLVDAGASFIGGCCGTNPDFILAMRTSLDQQE